jgi:hypothetical protein
MDLGPFARPLEAAEQTGREWLLGPDRPHAIRSRARVRAACSRSASVRPAFHTSARATDAADRHHRPTQSDTKKTRARSAGYSFRRSPGEFARRGLFYRKSPSSLYGHAGSDAAPAIARRQEPDGAPFSTRIDRATSDL